MHLAKPNEITRRLLRELRAVTTHTGGISGPDETERQLNTLTTLPEPFVFSFAGCNPSDLNSFPAVEEDGLVLLHSQRREDKIFSVTPS